jgi:hypothetical protein
LTIKARTAAASAVSAQSVPGGDALIGKGGKAPDLAFTNNSAKPLLINVVPYKDRLVAYVFTQSTLQRSVSVSSPSVILNQDGTIVVTENRTTSGDIQKQDTSTTSYLPLDTYR